jgi:hypothetical protein
MDKPTCAQTIASSTATTLRLMLANNHISTSVDRSLVEKTDQVRSLSASAHQPIQMLGFKPLFDGVKVLSQASPAWALYNLSRDPLWISGRFPIPARHLLRLYILHYAGIEFDALYVAHELPLDFLPGSQSLECSLIAPGPPALATELSHHLGHATDRIVSAYAHVIRKPIRAMALQGATGLAILRDPVLLGAVIPRRTNPEPGVPAAWFLLAAWRW